jgi:3-oxoacyl-[acyl-carrier protein] reductase
VNFLTSGSEAVRLKNQLGGSCHLFKADVSSHNEVNAMADFVRDKFGRLDNLINNAGLAVDGLLVRYDEDAWDRVIDVNLKGCFLCIRALSSLMAETGGGHVVNIASYSGLKGKAGQAAYSAAKAGVIGMSKTLAREMAPLDIRVNTVLPGYMETRMGAGAERALLKAREDSMLGRLSDPEEVAGFIGYLCATRTITGQVFSLDSREV